MLWRMTDGGGDGLRVAPRRRKVGLVVAIVGSDGSGKSTLCRDLTAELRARGPVDSMYFGSGDGKSSWLRWPLVQVRRVLPLGSTAARTEHSSTAGSSHTAPRRSPLVSAARVVWALTLAWEKRGKLRSVRRARERGRLVLCDRFPQAQIGGLMDGPLLHAWRIRRAGLRRTVAGWEERPYLRAEREPPDLLLRLIVDQEHAQRRRPDHDPADLSRRREVVAAWHFDGAEFGVVDLDATMPAAAVRRAAVQAIDACWDRRGEATTSARQRRR